jgi:hypothetical protein
MLICKCIFLIYTYIALILYIDIFWGKTLYTPSNIHLLAAFTILQPLVSMPGPSPRVYTPGNVGKLSIFLQSLKHFSQDGTRGKQSIKKRNKIRLADKC